MGSDTEPPGSEQLEMIHVMDELDALTERPEALPDELAVLRGLRQLLAGSALPDLSALAGWEDRYLHVVVTGGGSSPLRILYGDGYTQLDGPDVKYRGYMPPDELLAAVGRLLHISPG